MTTTPEQLQVWQEEFESAWPGFYSAKTDGIYDSDGREDQWQGYLRRCQETEQIMKLAKFGAMVIRNQYLDDKEQFISQLQSCAVADENWNIPLETRTVILELLK